MIFSLKLAFRELFNHRRLSFFFIFNLTIGLVAFILLDSFKLSVDNHLNKNSRAMMGADIMATSMQPVSQDDLGLIEGQLATGFERTDAFSFFSMVARKNVNGVTSSKLSEIMAIEDEFPFYGELALEDFQGRGVDLDQARRGLKDQSAWVYPLVASALQLKEGDKIQIGQTEFTARLIVRKDPGRRLTATGFAPRIYIHKKYFQKTELEGKGARIHYLHFYRITRPLQARAVAEDAKEALQKKHDAVSLVNVISHRDSGQQVGRLLIYIGDYLGLVSLVALFLSGIGAAYLFRTFLSKKMKEIAVLLSLGADKVFCYSVAVTQIFVLGVISAIFALLLALLAKPLLPQLLADFLPAGFETVFSVKSAFLTLFVSTLGALFFCLPFLSMIGRVQPLILLQETPTLNAEMSTKGWQRFLTFLPACLSLYGMSVWITNSFRLGGIFFLFFMLSIFLIGLIGFLLFPLFRHIHPKSNVVLQLAFRNLLRNKAAALSAFLALSIGALLLALIPLTHTALSNELKQSPDTEQPDFFLLGIQEDQVESLHAFGEKHGSPIKHFSPLIRGRAKKINNQPILLSKDKNLTREQQAKEFFKTRTVNMTYRSEINDSEKIIAGRPIQGEHQWDGDKPAEVSIEFRYAERMGYEIGDIVEYEVQGMPIEAEIVNFRKVKWTSFRPNFFISFQPGVLEMAPKVFLASTSNIPENKKSIFQNALVEDFPNISMINVEEVIAEMKKITEQMGFTVQIMAVFSIVAGFMVIFSIASYEVNQRRKEINLMKVLGGNFSTITQMVLIEFGIIGAISAITGTLISVALSFVLATFFFDNQWVFDFNILLQAIGLVIVVCLIVSFFASWRVLRQNPIALLKG